MTAVFRAVRLLVVLLVVTFLSYALLSLLPGDPVGQILGGAATPEAHERLRRELGLDDPLLVRYGSWLGGLLTGDFGTSYITGVPVLESLADRLPVTLELLAAAQLVALGVAVPAAVAAARRPGGPLDHALTAICFGLLSTPVFVLGVLLILVFAIKLKLLPATGWTPISLDLGWNLTSVLLPAVTIALPETAVYSRLLRTDLIATLQEDHITLARARGLSPRRILWRHALRPSAVSLVTAVGLNLGAMIGGAVIVETLFGLPGVGRFVVDSIFARDYLAVQGGVVLISVGYVLVNFAVDLAYAAVDPRIRRA
ncbi:ABC transporter permease [Planomonospora parontospora subsp. parontospora]|uniref:ABC transporter permease n=2 Tax=Planomonospora parontospora TaxID=58119 RepID=A0AA37BL33_9ACTN|nr:ABC transporter permease [Planomonospora parontospora]GGK87772.1 ABC transporter permease [Planomonospora parontospora]GII11480.1 ABC transporter permease [Planomonospora parontospora subsp. parontospora]